MVDHVKVEDLEVFRDFRAAVVKFAQAAEQSLMGADSTITRTRMWLESEQMMFWQSQARKRAEAVNIARDALRMKKLYKDSTGHTPDSTQEQKNLAKALAALEEAERKIDSIRKAMPRLDREADLYRGGVARLSGTLTGEIPKAIALLDRLAERLEEYVRIEAPIVADIPGATGVSEPSFSRGGDAAVEPPPAVDAAPEAAGGSEPADPKAEENKPKEGGDVADGQ